jgi:hypothetical protein
MGIHSIETAKKRTLDLRGLPAPATPHGPRGEHGLQAPSGLVTELHSCYRTQRFRNLRQFDRQGYRLVVHSGSETTKSMTSTPSEIATAKLRELVQADGSLDQEIRDAVIADLGDAQPSRLKALNGTLAGEKTDAALRAKG